MYFSRTKRRVLSAISGAVAASMILASNATVALWSDAVNLDGGVITSGNLDVEALGDLRWVDISDDRDPVEINPDAYRITPGDTIEAIKPLDVGLEGNNLMAVMGANLLTPNSGDLIEFPGGLKGTYYVTDENGNIFFPETPFGTEPNPERLVKVEDVSGTEVDGILDYEFHIKLHFDESTPDRYLNQTVAEIGEWEIYINQVREAPEWQFPGTQDPCEQEFSPECQLDPFSVVPTYELLDQNGDGLANAGETVRVAYNIQSQVDYDIPSAQIHEEGLPTGPFDISDISIPARSHIVKYKDCVLGEDDISDDYITSVVTPSMSSPAVWSGESYGTNFNVFSPPNLSFWSQDVEFIRDLGQEGKIDVGDIVRYTYGAGPYTGSGDGIKNLTVYTEWGDTINVPDFTSGTQTFSVDHEFTANDLINKNNYTYAPYATSEVVCITGLCGQYHSMPKRTIESITPTYGTQLDSSYSIVHDVGPIGVVSRGDQVVYEYTLRNTGNSVLWDATLQGVSGEGNYIHEWVDSAASGNNEVKWFITRNIGQSEVNSGSIQQNVSAVFTPSFCNSGGPCTSQSIDFNTITLPVQESTSGGNARVDVSIGMVNDTGVMGEYNVGDTINYELYFVNTSGYDILPGTTITDSLGRSFTTNTVIPSGGSVTFNRDYVIRVGDISNGQFNITADAVYQPGFCNGTVSNVCETVTLSGNNSISAIRMSTDFSMSVSSEISGDTVNVGSLNVGETYNVTYTIRNFGNSVLTGGIHSTDWASVGGVSVNPNETKTYTVSRVVTPADVSSGIISIDAMASLTPEGCVGDCYFESSDVVSTSNATSAPEGSFRIESTSWNIVTDKDTEPLEVANPGDEIVFNYVLVNDTNFSIPQGDVFSVIGSDGIVHNIYNDSVILPGGTFNFNVPYIVTELDLTNNNGVFNHGISVVINEQYNALCAIGNNCNLSVGYAESGSVSVYEQNVAVIEDIRLYGEVNFTRDYGVHKERGTNNYVNRANGSIDPGDAVRYIYRVGPAFPDWVPTDIVLHDSFGNEFDYNTTGDSEVFTHEVTYTAEELEGLEFITNTFYLTAKDPDTGEDITLRSKQMKTPVAPLVEELTGDVSAEVSPNWHPEDKLNPGETVNYTYKVTNTGNIPMTVKNPAFSYGTSPNNQGETYLDVAESVSWTTSKKVTLDDISTGVIDQVGSIDRKSDYCGVGIQCQWVSEEASSSLQTISHDEAMRFALAESSAEVRILPDYEPKGKLNPSEEGFVFANLKNNGFSPWDNVSITITEQPGSTRNYGTIQPLHKIIDSKLKIVPTTQEIHDGSAQRTVVMRYTPVWCPEVDNGGSCAEQVISYDVTLDTIPLTGGVTVTQTDRIVRDGSPLNELSVGEIWEIRYRVENTGDIALRSPQISSNNAWANKNFSYLHPGQIKEFVVSHEITPEDIEKGTYNIASFSAIPVECNGSTDCQRVYGEPSRLDRQSVPFTGEVNIGLDYREYSLISDINRDGKVNPGDTVVITWDVSNDGNWNHTSKEPFTYGLKNAQGNIDSRIESTVLSGSSFTMTTSHTVTREDVMTGDSLVVSAQLVYTPKYCVPQPNIYDSCETSRVDALTGGIPVEEMDGGVEAEMSYEIYRDFAPLEEANVGETIRYKADLTNIGTAVVRNVAYEYVINGKTKSGSGPALIYPEETGPMYMYYTVDEDDYNTGVISGYANISVTLDCPESDCPVVTVREPLPLIEVVEVISDMELTATTSIASDVNGDGLAQGGDIVRIDYTLTNNGNSRIDNIQFMWGAMMSSNYGIGGLNPGQTRTSSITRYVESGEVIDNEYDASAMAQGTQRCSAAPCPIVYSNASSHIIESENPNNVITLSNLSQEFTLDQNDDGVAQAGDIIRYRYTFANEGNVPLYTIYEGDRVSTLGGLEYTNQFRYALGIWSRDSTIYPGSSYETYIDYTVLEQDIANGELKNTMSFNYTPRYCDVRSDCEKVSTNELTSTVDATTAVNNIELSNLRHEFYYDQGDDGIAQPGDMVTYYYDLTNTGNVMVNLRSGGKRDSSLSPTSPNSNYELRSVMELSSSYQRLLPGESAQGKFTHTVSRSDVQSGVLSNTIKIGSEPTVCNGESSSSSCEYIWTNPMTDSVQAEDVVNNITITDISYAPSYDQGNDGLFQPGDSIEYSYTVRNDGNTAIGKNDQAYREVENITGSRNTSAYYLLGLHYSRANYLNPGDSYTEKMTYTIKEEDIVNGSLDMSVRVGITPRFCLDDSSPCETVWSNTVEASTDIEEVINKITLEPLQQRFGTDQGGDGIAQPGDSVVYTYTLTNTGNVDLVLANSATRDSSLHGEYNSSLKYVSGKTGRYDYTIQVGESVSKSITYRVTEDDTDLSTIGETVRIGYSPKYCDVDVTPCPMIWTNTETISTPTQDYRNELSLDNLTQELYSDQNGDGVAQPGDRIKYTYTLTNTSNTYLRLKNPAIIDSTIEDLSRNTNISSMTGISTYSYYREIYYMNPGTTITKYVTYTVKEEDVVSGSIDNTMKFGFSPIYCNEIASPCPTVWSDPLSVSMEAGPVVNDLSFTELTQQLYTDYNKDGIAQPGDRMKYTYTVTNNSNVNIYLPNPGSVESTIDYLDRESNLHYVTNISNSNYRTSLAPGGTGTRYLYYTLTEDDVRTGSLVNTMKFSYSPIFCNGVSNPCPELWTQERTVSFPTSGVENDLILSDLTQRLYYDANNDGIVQTGDRIEYAYTVRNDGNTLVKLSAPGVRESTISALNRTSTLGSVIGSGSSSYLYPNGQAVTKIVHTVTDEDMASGAVVNTTKIGYTPIYCESESDPCPMLWTNELTVAAQSGESITSSGQLQLTNLTATLTTDQGNDNRAQIGDVIQYTFSLKYTGDHPANRSLPGIRESTINGLSQEGAVYEVMNISPNYPLSPNESFSRTLSYTVTEQDTLSGTLHNTMRFAYTPPYCGGLNPCPVMWSNSRTVSTYVQPVINGLSLTDLTQSLITDQNNDGIAQEGDVIRYTFSLRNDSNVSSSRSLPGVRESTLPELHQESTIYDVMEISSHYPLSVNESFSRSVDYTVDAEDVASGVVVNTMRFAFTPELCNLTSNPCSMVWSNARTVSMATGS